MNTTAARKIDKLTPADAATAHSYNAKNLSPKTADNGFADEVISYLANARENRRARQVIEWERMGGRQLHHIN